MAFGERVVNGGQQMALSRHRVIRRKGRISLIEVANPKMGVGYSLKIGTLGLWSGSELAEGEKQFEQATSQSVE